jgi:Domain of unknown function (DUF5666)
MKVQGRFIMSKVTLQLCVICLGLLLSATAINASYRVDAVPGSAQQSEQAKPDTVTINGTVGSVSESTLTIVDSQKKEHTVAIGADTKVMKGGKAGALADIKANDRVMVEAKKGEGDAWTAVSILIK